MRVTTINFCPKDGKIIGNPNSYKDSKFVSQLDEGNVLGTLYLPCSQGAPLLGLWIDREFSIQRLVFPYI